jgi:hypothetical protein
MVLEGNPDFCLNVFFGAMQRLMRCYASEGSETSKIRDRLRQTERLKDAPSFMGSFVAHAARCYVCGYVCVFVRVFCYRSALVYDGWSQVMF